MEDSQTQSSRNGAASGGPAVAPGRRMLTANELRRLAEAADGTRGEVLQLVVDEDARPKLEKVTDLDRLPSNAVLVKTELEVPGRPLPKRVELTFPDGVRTRDLPTEIFDALFWGEAAAEKFLKPYYVRFYGDDEMRALLAAMADEEVIAIAHIYPTIYEEIKDRWLLEAIGDSRVRDEVWVMTAGEAFVGVGNFVPLSRWLALRFQ